MKLAHRLALLTAGVTAGTVATALVTAFVLVQHSARRELDEVVVDGAKAAAVVVTQLEDEAGHGVVSNGLLIPDEVALIVQRIAVYSVDGRRIASRPEVSNMPELLAEVAAKNGGRLNEPFDLELPDGPMRAVLVSSRALNGRTVLHAVSRSQLDEVVESRARLFAALFVGTLGLVLLSARWLGRRLAADVNRVTSVARRVASGELTARAGTAGLTSPETRNLARELDHMVAQLAALMASQRSFISYAAHELRSPLAAMQGELQLALRRPRSEEAYVETLGSVLTDVAALTQLAEDLLTLARAQAGHQAMERAVIGDVVDDAVRLVQGVAQIQDSKIECDISQISDTSVFGRRSDLARMLRNLLENAVKFGPRGGRVRLWGKKVGADVVIAVEDSGPGIDAKDQPGIFDPFYRGSSQNTKATAGTGLGLAIAREVAKKTGGDITLDTSHTQGARFLISLCSSPLGASRAGEQSLDLHAEPSDD